MFYDITTLSRTLRLQHTSSYTVDILVIGNGLYGITASLHSLYIRKHTRITSSRHHTKCTSTLSRGWKKVTASVFYCTARAKLTWIWSLEYVYIKHSEVIILLHMNLSTPGLSPTISHILKSIAKSRSGVAQVCMPQRLRVGVSIGYLCTDTWRWISLKLWDLVYTKS
jgi:hypothetical protein